MPVHTFGSKTLFAQRIKVGLKGQSAGCFLATPPAYRYEILDLNSKAGNCIPLADIRMGTWVHDIECHPGQGAKLARAAGTYAKIIKEPAPQCLVRLPSGVEKLIDSRCRATIGIVSNPNHGARKLRKAGQSRWLGRRPIVRGVAMNPVDHPHGGGEGRTKGGSDLDYFERRIGPHLPDPEETQCPPLAGRLGQTVESGGKRRIFAIEQVYPGENFQRYGVLGDDIVIAGRKVASVYEQSLKELGKYRTQNPLFLIKGLLNSPRSSEFGT
uniref:Large ribosomal subunit protein uL2 C-terminal domain-containing protein n=1 Tax=Ananas comosus var. bracteatus TaxID=296719 RepID=A0A6V7PYK1_ANACO|nr:unnamed protein product [Ananas comosus var. bracteatus]